MFNRPKTGDELWSIVKPDLVLAREWYGVEVHSVTTDNGPDAKKMRQLGKKEMPHIIWNQCCIRKSLPALGQSMVYLR